MRFFNLDLHVSVVADIKNIFQNLGHQVDTWSISGHSWVFGRHSDDVEVVNQNTWRNLNEDMANAFYDRYGTELSKYDGFIVTHTPSFAMLYEKFNKPIIVVASTRYEEPFSGDMVRWMKLNQYLQRKIDDGIVVPVANNKYDSRYAEFFTNRAWDIIPSICDYTNSKYEGTKDIFLYSSKCNIAHNIPNLVEKRSQLGFRYSWDELAKYKGIVHVPYNASTMSIFEQYSANIPLFFPDYQFMKELRNKFSEKGALSELSWNQVHGYSSNSAIPSASPDPNNYLDNDGMMEWAMLSDFYDAENMPFIEYFSSFENLRDKIDVVDLKSISRNMRIHNEGRKKKIYSKWEKILGSIE